ncbi:unnamed protein product [Ectocarpus sp. 6 AP-2014]
MAKDRLEEHPLAQEQSEFFCLEVYVADVESCSFSHTSVTPTVILSLLDFEPLVFDLSRTPPAQRQARRKRGPGFREVPQREEEDDQHDGIGMVESTNNTCRASSDGAQRDDHLFINRKSKTTATTRGKHASYADSENGQHHPKSFFCSKGKSCIFTANPADLSQALQNQSALTFLVASKLSQRQAAIHGSCAIDLSTFGPNAELSHSLPRAVSCWGHRTTRVESKDLKGATVARTGLTISLSCLGATGSLIHLTPARTGAASHRASENGSPSSAAPPRPDHSPPDGSAPGGLPMVHDQWTTEGAQLDGRARGHAPVAKQPGTDRLMCSHAEAGSARCGDGRTKESESGAGGTSAGAECWTCEYNPRDGRLVEPISSAAAVVEPAAVATAAGRDVSDADLGPERGGAVSPGDPCPAVEKETGAAAAVGGPPGDSAGAEADDNDDAETDTKTSPVRLSVAASVSNNDWLGPPGGDSRLQETPLQTEGCCSLDEDEGGGKKPDDIAATEEEGEAGAGQGRNKAARNFPGNNRLDTSWRPGAVPSHHEEGIVFDRRAAAVPSATSAAPGRGGPRNGTRRSTKWPTATARQNECGCWLGRRGARARASKDGYCKPSARATMTATAEAPLQGGRGGKTARRAWGAGPGVAVSATATALSGSGGISHTRASREGRGRGNEARHSERGRLAREPRPWSALPQRSAALGPAALQQFLPTWTSLVAEAAWLRGASSSAGRGESGYSDGGGGGGGGGGDGDGDDRANIAQHNRIIGELGTAETTTRKHNDWRTPKAPLPLLDPSVERCLMGWLRSRIDRNGAVAGGSTGEKAPQPQAVRDGGNNAPSDDRSCCSSSSSSSSSSSPPTKTTLQQPQDQHRHHQWLHPQQQQQQQRQDRTHHQRLARRRRTAERDDSAVFGQKRNGDNVEGTAGGGVPASCGIATTEERLYELFEDALKSLVEEGKAASAPGETVRGRRTRDSSSSAATRVGWVEVVRRVSSLSERTRVDATVAEEQQQPRPHDSAPATSVFRPREGQEELRQQPRDNGHPAQQTDKNTDAGVGPDQRKGAGRSSASSSRSSTVCAVNKCPPPISIQPYRRLSPPPRLPPLNTRSPSPPPSPPPKVLTPSPLVAAGLVRPSSSPRQRRAATAASPTTIAPAEAATAAPYSPRSPTSPRASLWLAGNGGGGGGGGSRGHRSPRSVANETGRVSGGSVIGSGMGGRGANGIRGGAIGATTGGAGPSLTSESLLSTAENNTTGAGEVGEEESRPPVAAGCVGVSIPPPFASRSCFGVGRGAREDDTVGEEEEEQEEGEGGDGGGVLVLEEYESDFEAEEE